MFFLDSRLAADSVPLGHFPLSQVRLMRDANYPWCLLIPEREDVTEIHHLSDEDRHQLMDESCRLSEAMADLFAPRKINVAALGNVVPQLHLHHIARFEADPAWPGPVWGRVPALAYSEALQAKRCEQLVAALVAEDFIPA